MRATREEGTDEDMEEDMEKAKETTITTVEVAVKSQRMSALHQRMNVRWREMKKRWRWEMNTWKELLLVLLLESTVTIITEMKLISTRSEDNSRGIGHRASLKKIKLKNIKK